jgi:hypothetical protein
VWHVSTSPLVTILQNPCPLKTKPPRQGVWICWTTLAQTSFINSTPWSCTFTSTLGPPAWVAASPYFLESAAAIQKAVKAGECNNREELRKRNDKEVVEKAQTKKGRRLLANTVDKMEECDPTTSFGEAYGKQLEVEEVHVDTEHSREQRENTQYLITKFEGLIAKATTPQEKSAYECTHQSCFNKMFIQNCINCFEPWDTSHRPWTQSR